MHTSTTVSAVTPHVQRMGPLKRRSLRSETVARFLNSYAGDEINVSAVVIDFVARDQEISPQCPGIRPDAIPEVIRNFVVRDSDVLILIPDFDPACLAGRIVQIDLSIEDLVRVDL